jgi:NAD(P)-dependent dehydrogenase (short-subunit alcohol dehydrogenase family)
LACPPDIGAQQLLTRPIRPEYQVMEADMGKDVLVIIGAGGMGLAIARRLAPGKTVLLADHNEAALTAAAETLRDEGHDVRAERVDVSSPDSVAALAKAAAALGEVARLAHTAGLAPTQAPVAVILQVDLLGVAIVLDEFGRIIAPGGAGVVIASMAGHLSGPLPAEQEQALASTPTPDLLALPFASPDVLDDPGIAYGLAKRANMLRVQAAAPAWGERGARVNSISPGVISTPMGRQELDSPFGAVMRAMVEDSPAKRLGTPEDIAGAAAFLLGPDATFITGTDLLVDGGVVSAARSSRRAPRAA